MTKQEMIDLLNSYTGTPEESILGELYTVLCRVAHSLSEEYNDDNLDILISDYRDAPSIIMYIHDCIEVHHWELHDLDHFIGGTVNLTDYVYRYDVQRDRIESITPEELIAVKYDFINYLNSISLPNRTTNSEPIVHYLN